MSDNPWCTLGNYDIIHRFCMLTVQGTALFHELVLFAEREYDGLVGTGALMHSWEQ